MFSQQQLVMRMDLMIRHSHHLLVMVSLISVALFHRKLATTPLRHTSLTSVAKVITLYKCSKRPKVLAGTQQPRSEEHTSELQSRPHLVCRLLLEKKKNKKTN